MDQQASRQTSPKTARSQSPRIRLEEKREKRSLLHIFKKRLHVHTRRRRETSKLAGNLQQAMYPREQNLKQDKKPVSLDMYLVSSIGPPIYTVPLLRPEFGIIKAN
jgi:hypothetical protein